MNNNNTLFHLLETPVKKTDSTWTHGLILFLPAVLAAKAREAERSWFVSILFSILYMSISIIADFGHVIGHILSARYGNAPMDKIVLVIQPATIYKNNDVTPNQHRWRAIGGTIANNLLLLGSLALRSITQPKTLLRELADWSCIYNAFLAFGSLLPLPIIDGGSLLKWSLVEHKNFSPAEGDWAVEQTNLALGATTVGIGGVLASRKKWWMAIGCIAVGAVSIGASLGKVK